MRNYRQSTTVGEIRLSSIRWYFLSRLTNLFCAFRDSCICVPSQKPLDFGGCFGLVVQQTPRIALQVNGASTSRRIIATRIKAQISSSGAFNSPRWSTATLRSARKSDTIVNTALVAVTTKMPWVFRVAVWSPPASALVSTVTRFVPVKRNGRLRR